MQVRRADAASPTARNALASAASRTTFLLDRLPARVGWALLTAVTWALGWTVTTAAGVAVEEQFVVFGISGAFVAAGLQSLVIPHVVPARPANP